MARATVSDNTFGNKPNALAKLTGKDSKTVIPENSNTVKFEKVSFYLTPEQVESLDEACLAYKKATGKRINRNDIVRHLVEQLSVESLIETLE